MMTPTMRRALALIARGRPRVTLRNFLAGLSVWVVTAMFAVSAWALPNQVKVTDVTLSAPKEGTARIVVRTSVKPTYTARVTDGGKRILLDISDAVTAGAPPAIVEGNNVVAGVMTQTFPEAKATRVLIQLSKNAQYSVIAREDGLTIDLSAAEKTGPMAAPLVVSQPAPAAVPVDSDDVLVKDVRYSHQSDRERVIIETDREATHVAEATKKGVRIEIKGARLPKSLAVASRAPTAARRARPRPQGRRHPQRAAPRSRDVGGQRRHRRQRVGQRDDPYAQRAVGSGARVVLQAKGLGMVRRAT
jgi:hypothetical protein